MVNKRKPYKTYTREFKIEALRLMEGSGRPPADIAMELGIRRNQLYKWKEQLAGKGDTAFPSQRGRPRKDNQSELTSLRQENQRLREEVEILKKAAASTKPAVASMDHRASTKIWCPVASVLVLTALPN